MKKRLLKFSLSVVFMMLLSGCAVNENGPLVEGNQPISDTESTMIEPTSYPASSLIPLPLRSGPRTQTTGSVPHVQIGVEPVPSVDEELRRRAFALPGVENRPTVVSLPGAQGMWLSDGVDLVHPEVEIFEHCDSVLE